MSATAYPSIQQYRAMANKVDARPSVALRELKRRLEGTLMEDSALDLITDFNTQLGLATKDARIRHPKFIGGAPVRDSDGYANCITMGLSNEAEFEGNREYKNTFTLSIYSIDERIDTEEQYWRTWDRIGLIRIALHPFLSGCVDEEDRVCWRSLVPMQSGMEMDDWETYGGIYCFYRMICDPSQNTWS